MTVVQNPKNKNSDALDIGLFDGIFTHNEQKAIGLGGDNTGEQPKFIRWHKGEFRPVTVFTDTCLSDALKAPASTRKIAWLLEPRGLRENAYNNFHELQREHKCFDWLITHDLPTTMLYPNSVWCPLGGAWVHKVEKETRKTKLVSMMTTEKKRALGHQLRAQLQQHFTEHQSKIDMYGRGSVPIQSKRSALAEYRFTVVVESCQIPGYFTEKLIDAFLSRTIPIYWGAPDIYRYFDPDGMIICNSADEIIKAVETLSADLYEKKHINILRNQIRCDFVRCAEDYAYLKYPWIFETQ